MADDTRQSPTGTDPKKEIQLRDFNAHPENKEFSGEQWKEAKEQFRRPPIQNANVLAGGTENTAGGKMKEVSISNAFEGGIGLKDFTDLPKKPCVKDSSMNAMIAGFAVGGVRTFLGSPLWRSANWAAATFCLSAFTFYTYCDYKRRASKEGMLRAVEIMNRNAIEKEQQRQRKEKEQNEKREQKDKELDKRYAAVRESDSGGGKPWWKVW